MNILLMILLILTGIFLIVLILIQRGKGGGLAGAFGGMGGQSAFGTKAGDLFTKITIGLAAFWIILCIVSVRLMGTSESVLNPTLGGAKTPLKESSAPASTDKQPATNAEKPAQGTPSTPAKSP
jgi:preprotein translocase subunit SecG